MSVHHSCPKRRTDTGLPLPRLTGRPRKTPRARARRSRRQRRPLRPPHRRPRSWMACTRSLGPRRSCDMSLESPWLGVLGAIFVPALGHLYHFILAVNITSGWGLRETSLARLRLVLLAILVASPAFLLARHVRDPWWNWVWPLRAYPMFGVTRRNPLRHKGRIFN